jgi:hypothetical protein
MLAQNIFFTDMYHSVSYALDARTATHKCPCEVSVTVVRIRQNLE